jgi:hypothetical protein
MFILVFCDRVEHGKCRGKIVRVRRIRGAHDGTCIMAVPQNVLAGRPR